MYEFSNYLVVGGVTGITATLGFILWWKHTLRKEIVKPDIDAVNKRIDFLEDRTTKLEELHDRIQDNLENKIDKMQDSINTLTKEVAQLTGQLKAIRDIYDKR